MADAPVVEYGSEGGSGSTCEELAGTLQQLASEVETLSQVDMPAAEQILADLNQQMTDKATAHASATAVFEGECSGDISGNQTCLDLQATITQLAMEVDDLANSQIPAASAALDAINQQIGDKVASYNSGMAIYNAECGGDDEESSSSNFSELNSEAPPVEYGSGSSGGSGPTVPPTRCAELADMIAGCQNEIQSLQDQISDKQTMQSNIDGLISGVQSDIAGYQSEQQGCTGPNPTVPPTRCNELALMISGAQDELQSLQSQKDALPGEISALQNQLTAAQGDLSEYQLEAEGCA